jgi:signal transduction histidine kinase
MDNVHPDDRESVGAVYAELAVCRRKTPHRRSEIRRISCSDAQASHIEVSLATRDGNLQLAIRDDGVGGADPARGSGLVGLADRVEALGGSIQVRSGAGDGMHITAQLPLEFESAANLDDSP